MRVIAEIPDELVPHLETVTGRRTLAKMAGLGGHDARYFMRLWKDRVKGERRLTPREVEQKDMLHRMAGLSTKMMPMKYRRILAECLMETEKALALAPKIEIKADGEKEAAVLLMSDWHTGKRVYSESGTIYNKDIAAYKFSLLKSRVIHLLTNHQRLDNFDLFAINLLGDIVDGSGIYPFQELNQDLTAFHDQVGLAVAGIWDLALAIHDLGLPVIIRGVRGNHGRQAKDAHPDNNFDLMVYMLLKFMASTEDKLISVDYARNTEYLNYEIKGHKVHLRHEAPAQAETPAARAKFAGWKGMHDYDLICYAHLHHPGVGTFLDSYTIMNGWPVGPDDLSERIAKYSRPSQTLFGLSPGIGKSFHYDLYLDDLGEGDEYERLIDRYPQLK